MKTSLFTVLFALVLSMANGQISKRIDSLALEYQAEGFNGNILYSKNDSILFTGNYGFRDFSEKKPLNDSTIFELASLSKQFTALAIVQLIEKGHLRYDSKVVEILRSFPYQSITVEHLLRHQSGLPEYQRIFYKRKNWNRRNAATNKDLLNVLSELRMELEFEPGSKYKYSNTGYAFLGSIIEQISGQSYEKYIQENIFVPAGMANSKVQGKDEYLPNSRNIALGYTYDNRKKEYQKVENDREQKHIHWLNNIVGNRGVYASILDLEKWKNALRHNTLITKKSKQKMLSTDSISRKYGFGFAIYTTTKGKWVYHNGSWSGYKTTALYLVGGNKTKRYEK